MSLKQLVIKNYALIDHTDISFDEGMSVITGETGAGKSIMLGALGMLLGQKADAQVLLDKEQKCVVEATFDLTGRGLKPLFEQAELDYDDLTIIRREILPSGKARAFVNDSPANVAFLKEIGASLIDIHSQHQNLLLSQGAFHLDVVDSVAHTENELAEYGKAYNEFRDIEKQLRQLKELNAKQGKEVDYDRHLLAELNKAELSDPDEMAALEKRQEMCDKAEDIKLALSNAVNALSAEQTGILDQLHETLRNLDKIADFMPKDSNAIERIESARIDLDDILASLQDQYENVDFDPDEQQKVVARLNVLNSLTQKHGVGNTAELIEIRENLKRKLAAIDSFDEQLEELGQQLDKARKELTQKAQALSEKRNSVSKSITDYIEGLLHDMGMGNARFIIENTQQDFTPTGTDALRFLFAANKNGTPTDIAKVASGGEMSRVMLSIKSLLSHSKNLPTIIFDEIDTGVSGEVADKMGRIMADMASNMQVIAITHLPQVASQGKRHYVVFKQDTDSRTVSNIKLLDHEERVREIAKMLSGSQVSDAALANAKELLS